MTVDRIEVDRTAHQVGLDHGRNGHVYAEKLAAEARKVQRHEDGEFWAAVAAALLPRSPSLNRPPNPDTPGVPISSSTLARMSFELAVVDIFHINGRSTIFTGKVAAGEVRIGDRLVLRSPNGHFTITVKLLEPRGLWRSGAIAGDNVGIVTDYMDLGPVADGIRQLEFNRYEILSLKLLSPDIGA